jgi:alkanesulfonate monooxygenase SsuD/methylene tetrahydromethanopterin reductase-like flavin-dependent oxidoreductase (luciferase family)
MAQDRCVASASPPRFGLNLNNRAPLLSATYRLEDLLDQACRAEALGFDSLWVGDSLFSKPRHEPLTLLAALSQRTSRVSQEARLDRFAEEVLPCFR